MRKTRRCRIYQIPTLFCVCLLDTQIPSPTLGWLSKCIHPAMCHNTCSGKKELGMPQALVSSFWGLIRPMGGRFGGNCSCHSFLSDDFKCLDCLACLHSFSCRGHARKTSWRKPLVKDSWTTAEHWALQFARSGGPLFCRIRSIISMSKQYPTPTYSTTKEDILIAMNCHVIKKIPTIQWETGPTVTNWVAPCWDTTHS